MKLMIRYGMLCVKCYFVYEMIENILWSKTHVTHETFCLTYFFLMPCISGDS